MSLDISLVMTSVDCIRHLSYYLSRISKLIRLLQHCSFSHLRINGHVKVQLNQIWTRRTDPICD